MSEENYPVHSAIKVLDGVDIYKTSKWWKAVLLCESFGHKQILIYQWLKDNKSGKWKRKQKMGIKNIGEWKQILEAVQKFESRLNE